jgi:hypothetical protein
VTGLLHGGAQYGWNALAVPSIVGQALLCETLTKWVDVRPATWSWTPMVADRPLLYEEVPKFPSS